MGFSVGIIEGLERLAGAHAEGVGYGSLHFNGRLITISLFFGVTIDWFSSGLLIPAAIEACNM